MNKKEKTGDELLMRVFKLVSTSHFNDHKLSPNYLEDFIFPRGLGEDVSNWVRNYHNEYYKLKENGNSKDKIK
jgi:hypothetical protein